MYARVCLLIGVCLLISGCSESGPEIASVKGKVTMDGKPLANAAVVFIPENGRPAGARTDAEGNYELNFTQGRKGTMPGKNQVGASPRRQTPVRLRRASPSRPNQRLFP